MGSNATFVVVVVLVVVVSAAAAGADLSGRWEGAAAIPGAAAMPLVVDFERDAHGRWPGSVVLPGQGVKGAALAELSVHDDRLSAILAAAIPSFGSAGAADGRLYALE